MNEKLEGIQTFWMTTGDFHWPIYFVNRFQKEVALFLVLFLCRCFEGVYEMNTRVSCDQVRQRSSNIKKKLKKSGK